MRGLFAASALTLLLLPAVAGAQRDVPNFSGRWVLVDTSKAALGEPDTLEVNAPDELVITQTPLAITVDHPSKPGSHPAAGTFKFGEGGRIGVPVGDARASTESRWGVSFFGHQLIISNSSTTPDAAGVKTTVAHGSIWSLEPTGRLVIEFGERRTGARPKIATRVYVTRQ